MLKKIIKNKSSDWDIEKYMDTTGMIPKDSKYEWDVQQDAYNRKVTTFDLKKQAQLDLIERIQDDLISVLEGDEFDKEAIIDYLQNLKPIEYEVKEQTYNGWEHMDTRATFIDMGTQVKNFFSTGSRIIPNVTEK
jgi:hypothetical protein